MVQAFNPPELWSPFGAFSMAVIQGDGHRAPERSDLRKFHGRGFGTPLPTRLDLARYLTNSASPNTAPTATSQIGLNRVR
jgi:hypothetical protein